MKKKKQDAAILGKWQDRLDKNKAAYAPILEKMVLREEQYKGSRDLKPTTENDMTKKGKHRKTNHVYNITQENLESEIDINIEMPKVIAVRRADEFLAIMAEHMLRNELERLLMEEINDMAGRTCLKQGGVFYLIEWDETKRTHTTCGTNVMQTVHPQRMIPQDGVEELRNMEYFFLLLPQTKSEVKRRYGVDVSTEKEEMPELRGVGTDSTASADELVTLVEAYYKNDSGGIGRVAFVGDTLCENKDDCLSRVQRVCKKCGQTETDGEMMLSEPTLDGSYPQNAVEKPRKGHCAYCGADSWEEKVIESQKVHIDELEELGVRPEVVQKLKSLRGYGLDKLGAAKNLYATHPSFASQMPPSPQGDGFGAAAGFGRPMAAPTDSEGIGRAMRDPTAIEDGGGAATIGEIAQDLAMGMPTQSFRTDDMYVEIPYYKPLEYPLVLQRNVSCYGSFLGSSDCDAIADQQNTVNRLEQKVLDLLVKAGKKIAMPDKTSIRLDAEDNEAWHMASEDLAQVREFEFTANIEPVLAYMAQVYEESRRVLGITDSFQGRKDTTATSGKAKEFAAAQSAGRMESKRIMKKAAMEQVFKLLFQNMLAYCSEKRPVRSQDDNGKTKYEEWCSYAYLDVDEAGELYWNDNFLFTCDSSAGLASNREAMWQETTMHLQTGAFGNPQEIGTLVIYWTQMQALHYPGAGKIKQLLEQRMKEQQQQQMQMAQMQMQQAQMAQAAQNATGQRPMM